MEGFTVYILYSQKTNKFYKGSTSNLDDRLKRHQQGREKYTKAGTPWTLIWHKNTPTKSEAIKFEYKLKNLSRKRLIQFMTKYQDGIAGPDKLLLLQQLSGC